MCGIFLNHLQTKEVAILEVPVVPDFVAEIFKGNQSLKTFTWLNLATRAQPPTIMK